MDVVPVRGTSTTIAELSSSAFASTVVSALAFSQSKRWFVSVYSVVLDGGGGGVVGFVGSGGSVART